MLTRDEYAQEQGFSDYKSLVASKGILPEDQLIKKSEAIQVVSTTIEESKDTIYNLVKDIKSGHFDFSSENILEALDILLEDIKNGIEKI